MVTGGFELTAVERGAGRMRVWADVYVSDGPLRSVLDRSALFYIPKFYDAAHDNGITLTHLYALATTINQDPEIDIKVPGRLAIKRIWECVDPVAYNNAVRALNLLNEALRIRSVGLHLETTDIVACVFRLRDGPEIKSGLGPRLAEIGEAAAVDSSVVNAALDRGRITYRDAHAIWAALYARKKKESKFLPEINSITAKEADLIAVDRTTLWPPRVLKVDRADPEVGIRESFYVYKRDNLSPAPRSGHDWAVDDSVPSSAKARR